MSVTSSDPERIINIAVLSNELEDRYHTQYFRGIKDHWKKYNINLFLFVGRALESNYLIDFDNTISYADMYNSIFEIAKSKRIDGLLVLSGTLANFISVDQLLRFLSCYPDVPKVSLAYKLKGIPSITVDNASGMRELTEHFIKFHKYKNIAFIQGPQENLEAQLRFKIFMETCRGNGVTVEENNIFQGDFICHSGHDAIKEFWDLRKIRPDAIIAANDEMAYGAYCELQDRNIRIPQDVAIGGFDDIDEFRQLEAPFTTVNQPIRELATQGLQLLIDQMNHPQKQHKDLILPTQLIVRRSCGCDYSQSFDLPNFEKIDREILNNPIHPDAT
ncbi:MAG: substrate-binding domain-containing protein [Spirochaetaceae bacterium]|jgi:DNA-binding LacI/PurR family transcriptional regulator|nr:substrate-binding domain-containing protein [Spirochaetaceae bacterium]